MNINLKEVSQEINQLLENKRKELCLSFIEEKHIYYMLGKDGKVTSKFPSVSKVIKQFYEPFDSETISLRMAKGNRDKQKLILEEWKAAGDFSTNMGSRVHYELESEVIDRYGNYKEVRRPIFNINEEQQNKSDKMIVAGKNYLDLMEERGAVLLDTELIMGHTDEGYTGQCDNAWLMMNKNKDNFGFVITDYKTNQPKNFEINSYTGKLYSPFNAYPNNALGHYYLQIPFYGKLLVKMLSETKYKDAKFLGGVVVLLKDDATYVEYKVPGDVNNTIMGMDMTNYVK